MCVLCTVLPIAYRWSMLEKWGYILLVARCYTNVYTNISHKVILKPDIPNECLMIWHGSFLSLSARYPLVWKSLYSFLRHRLCAVNRKQWTVNQEECVACNSEHNLFLARTENFSKGILSGHFHSSSVQSICSLILLILVWDTWICGTVTAENSAWIAKGTANV